MVAASFAVPVQKCLHVPGGIGREGNPTRETVVVPPSAVAGSRKEVEVEAKTMIGLGLGVPEIEVVARDGILAPLRVPRRLPTRQLQETIGEAAEIVVGGCLHHVRRSENQDEAVGRVVPVLQSALLPLLLGSQNLGSDGSITVTHVPLAQYTEEKLALTGGDAAELAGLPRLAPMPKRLVNFMLFGVRPMQ
jgi:hypothetical protein